MTTDDNQQSSTAKSKRPEWLEKYPEWTLYIRTFLLSFYVRTGLFTRLDVQRRMELVHVGFSGHVSLPDKSAAEDLNLKPLAGITLWMLKPAIDMEKHRRQECFADAISDILGEDVDDWY